MQRIPSSELPKVILLGEFFGLLGMYLVFTYILKRPITLKDMALSLSVSVTVALFYSPLSWTLFPNPMVHTVVFVVIMALTGATIGTFFDFFID